MQSPSDEQLVGVSSKAHLLLNAVPSTERAAERDRAFTIVTEALADFLDDEAVWCSPLGSSWTDVFEAHVSRLPPPDGLCALGWLRLDNLYGNSSLTRQLWAVTADNKVLAGVQLRTDAHEDPVMAVLDRASHRGEVRLREVLELRTLLRRGHRFPVSSAVLDAAADIESGLGGRELVRWATGRRLTAPAALPNRSLTTRRQLVVAISGVDGSGKSTLLDSLERDLAAAGVQVGKVWLRPGMGLGRIAALAVHVKRRLGMDQRPGVGVVAATPDISLPSRRGLMGWLWSLLVTATFVVGIRRRNGGACDVMLYDRHVVDALVTLDFVYGATDLRLQQWLVRHLTPRADTTFYLDVPPELAVSRKPGDMIGAAAVVRQLESYTRWLAVLPGMHRLTATRPAAELSREALAALTAATTSAAGRPAGGRS